MNRCENCKVGKLKLTTKKHTIKSRNPYKKVVVIENIEAYCCEICSMQMLTDEGKETVSILRGIINDEINELNDQAQNKRKNSLNKYLNLLGVNS